MKPIRALAYLAGVALSLPALGQDVNRDVLERRARDLGTDGRSSQLAHETLIDGKERSFPYPTIILGIEKAPRDRIRPPSQNGWHSPEEREILGRLQLPESCASIGARAALTPQESRQCELIEQQQDSLERYLDDGKRAFISHIALWPTPGDPARTLLHNVYVDCADPAEVAAQLDCDASAYDNSWASLDKLESVVDEWVARGDFTHILLLSKGWNTKQVRSIDEFQQLTMHLEAQRADREFKPLVIGITWHSGWVWGVSSVPILKLAPIVASYGNKAKDADEIGITWVNALTHRVLLPAAQTRELPVVAIGHSFGARILTRAAASAGLLGESPQHKISLLISLQGAFSMNRLLPERCNGKEGAPYADLTEQVDRLVLVWSRRDTTNPLAQIVSHANHVGGKPGHRRARAYSRRFRFRKWGPGWVDPRWNGAPKDREPCGCLAPAVPKVEMVEATSIVKRHGDVNDDEIAALLWALLTE